MKRVLKPNGKGMVHTSNFNTEKSWERFISFHI
jgi:hypothetical protein